MYILLSRPPSMPRKNRAVRETHGPVCLSYFAIIRAWKDECVRAKAIVVIDSRTGIGGAEIASNRLGLGISSNVKGTPSLALVSCPGASSYLSEGTLTLFSGLTCSRSHRVGLGGPVEAKFPMIHHHHQKSLSKCTAEKKMAKQD